MNWLLWSSCLKSGIVVGCYWVYWRSCMTGHFCCWSPAINRQPPHTTQKYQTCFSLQPRHYSSQTAPNLQHTANQVMYNFRFTILMNANNTSNCQSTNETHHTQENTTITTHKISQLLILTETRYQIQQSHKELHTEHTPLRTTNLH